MVQTSEESLRMLKFQFAKNGHKSLVEFEVTSPTYFRIVVEPNKIPKARNFFLPSIESPKGTTIDIRFDLDSDEKDTAIALLYARQFITILAEKLPKKPWSGLDRLDIGREERRWKELFSE